MSKLVECNKKSFENFQLKKTPKISKLRQKSLFIFRFFPWYIFLGACLNSNLQSWPLKNSKSKKKSSKVKILRNVTRHFFFLIYLFCIMTKPVNFEKSHCIFCSFSLDLSRDNQRFQPSTKESEKIAILRRRGLSNCQWWDFTTSLEYWSAENADKF